jgi:hypothetical protein
MEAFSKYTYPEGMIVIRGRNVGEETSLRLVWMRRKEKERQPCSWRN